MQPMNEAEFPGPNHPRIKGAYVALATAAAHPEYGGVAAKISAQVKGINASGIPCSLRVIAGPHSFFGNFLNWLPFFPSLEKWEPDSALASCDFLYIRKPAFTRRFLRFLASMKTANPAMRIILEMPTYPYDDEMQSFWDKVTLLRERHYRKRLHEHVDRIADLSRHDEVFGISTLPIINGIDLSLHAPRIPSFREDEIHILSVSSCSFWHGIDRAIEGLGRYYAGESPSRKVVLHVAGDGPELANLKGLAQQLHVEPYVEFHGAMDKAGIDALYDRCAIGLEILGNHRKGLALSSSLKSREYLAKGLPFVYSGKIDVLEQQPFDLCMEVPADESPLDIEQLALFYGRVYREREEALVIEQVRDYAERNVSMESALASVIEYLKGES